VPKAGGHLNVGAGGMSTKLKARGQQIRQHWDRLTQDLASLGVAGRDWDPGGYTYYCRPRTEHVRKGNAFLCGDAAGMATRDLFEGIGPAIASGQAAARSIIDGVPYDLAAISAYSCPPGLARRALEYLFVTRRR
jgi:flavin-dependent dehydrogenase